MVMGTAVAVGVNVGIGVGEGVAVAVLVGSGGVVAVGTAVRVVEAAELLSRLANGASTPADRQPAASNKPAIKITAVLRPINQLPISFRIMGKLSPFNYLDQ
jgi:hypothetical protein